MPMKHIESIHQAAAALMSADKTSHSSEVLNNDVALAKVVIYLSDKPMEWGLNTQLQEMLKEPVCDQQIYCIVWCETNSTH